METIRGKKCSELDFDGLRQRIGNYHQVALDLGTGDGRFVQHLAQGHPDWFVIGIDACRENLDERSRRLLPNALFIIAAAQALPRELEGLVSQLTINFPWGSLLDSLLRGDPALMDGLASLTTRPAAIEVRLNDGALAEAGRMLAEGTDAICDRLARAGWVIGAPRALNAAGLHTFPTTWARRLAWGRDPHAVQISGGRS